jgi:DNA-binding CsgD family transcriptional regulator
MNTPAPELRLGDLTDKQREVLSLIADNRTSKEIAGFLGITESAVNQRIESIRARLGGVPRAHLARLFRQLTQADDLPNDGPDKGEPQETGDSTTCNSLTADNIQLTQTPAGADREAGSLRVAPYSSQGAEAATAPPPEAVLPELHMAELVATEPVSAGSVMLQVVPPILDGRHGTVNRLLAMVGIAVGLLILVLVGLGVAQALNKML